MAILTTKAIVFSSIKYGDTSLIVKCFTLEEGIKSYMIKGVLKAKKGKLKAAYFQPLTLLNLTVSHNNKGNLNSIREANVYSPYERIPLEIKKQSIVLFLSEILSSIIQEEEKNESLFNYIETALIWLDTHDEIANFHLLFLLNLSKYLGFYPDTSDSSANAFNLLEGSFTTRAYEKLTLIDADLKLFKRLLGINFDAIHTISFNKNERQTLLRIIIQYFELHLEGFKKPKSLDVLETVFS